jgi:hypothetical protein
MVSNTAVLWMHVEMTVLGASVFNISRDTLMKDVMLITFAL